MPMRLGSPMPPLEGATGSYNAEGFDPGSLAGHPTLVHFWAVSCHICHEVMDQVSQYRDQYGPKGLKVVAITSLAHSRAVASGHPSGRKLYEIADWVIDNGCPHGDAVLDFGPGRPRVAPLSTVAGVVIWNMIVAEVAARLAADQAAGSQAGAPAAAPGFPFWVSANVEGGAEANRRYIEVYRDRWHGLV